MGDGATKELGFFASLNWSVGLIVLFPLFLFVGAEQIAHCRNMLASFTEQRLVTLADGTRLRPNQLEGKWEEHHARTSWLLWPIFAVVIAVCGAHWWDQVGRALMEWQMGDSVPGWGTAAILAHPTAPNPWPSMAFSFVAYLYQALATFLYWVILLYSVSFAGFLCSLSSRRSTNKFRLVMRRTELTGPLRRFYYNAYAGAVLGLLYATLMHLQTEYVAASSPNIVAYLADGYAKIGAWVGLLADHPEAVVVDKANLAEFSSWAFFGISVFCIVIATHRLDQAMKNAKEFYDHNAADDDWRKRFGFLQAANPNDAKVPYGFLTDIARDWIKLIVVALAILASMVSQLFGVVVLPTVFLATYQLFVRRRSVVEINVVSIRS